MCMQPGFRLGTSNLLIELRGHVRLRLMLHGTCQKGSIKTDPCRYLETHELLPFVRALLQAQLSSLKRRELAPE